MGFDAVVVTSVSSNWFNATGIDNGDDETDSFNGDGHSVEENLSLATWHSSDPKVWLTESAFESAHESLTIDAICNYCYGIVSDSGYVRYEKISRREYNCYFNEDSIITRFAPPCEHGDTKYIDCGDGTKVLTDVCIMGDWYHSDADCEHCFFDSQRVRELSDGTLETSHQCAESGGPWIPVDRCEGVACGTLCDGGDLWSQKCVDGVCVKDALLVVNSPVCPQPDPDPKPQKKSPWLWLAIILIALYLYLKK